MTDTNPLRHDSDLPDRPDLDMLYAPPSEMIRNSVLDRLIDVHEDYLKVATFFCLATASQGGMDASPRGGPPGFVRVLDPRLVAFADWPGNNRIESMRKLQHDDRVGLLFLFPGLELFLRINGRARVSTRPDLLARLREGERSPKTAILVSIKEVLGHCGKAVNRARLWADASRIDRSLVPSVGQMAAAVARLDPARIKDIDAHYDRTVRYDLY